MNKAVLIFGFLLVIVAFAEANCPGSCEPNVPSKSVCIVESGGKQCRKIKGCTLREENCERKRQNKPLLRAADMSRCIHIRGHTGTGRCAPIRPTSDPK